MAEEDEDYELVPHKIVSELKKEVDELKRNPLGTTSTGQDLQASMNALAHSINDLLQLFKDATEQMHVEEKDSHVFTKRLDPMLDKLDTIIEQNQTIAKGILAVADMLKEHLKHKPRFGPGPSLPTSPPMQMSSQNPFAAFGGPGMSVPRVPPPPVRPSYAQPFPEFNPMTQNESMPRPMAPFGSLEQDRSAPKSIPPAPPPPRL